MTNVTTSAAFEFLNSSSNITFNNCGNYMPIVSLLAQILYMIVCLVGILGNTLVIYVVLRFSKMQTVTNMYILNLAIADECFLIGIPFLVTTISLKSWPFGMFMCKAYMTSTSVNQFTSSIFLFIMSADRYIAVCHPISSPTMRTPFISQIVSVSAWIVSIIFMTPVFLYANVMAIDGTLSCNIFWPHEYRGQTTFTLYTFILGFAIPLVLIFIFYFLVIKKLQTVGPQNKSKEKKRSHRKVTRLVLTVITVYVLCWLPYWLTQVALINTEPNQCKETNVTIFLFAGFLSYANSAMNPILYAFLSDNFKKSFTKACTCVAGKDINAALHNENSICQRGKTSKGGPSTRNVPSSKSKSNQTFEEGECGLLLSNEQSANTTVTLTPRSNNTTGTINLDTIEKEQLRENPSRENRSNNGAQLTHLTQV